MEKDIMIPCARYAELIIAEEKLNKLQEVLIHRSKHYSNIKFEEVWLIKDLLFGVDESEGE